MHGNMGHLLKLHYVIINCFAKSKAKLLQILVLKYNLLLLQPDVEIHDFLQSPERLNLLGWQKRVETATEKLGATFLNYDLDNGNWVFTVSTCKLTLTHPNYIQAQHCVTETSFTCIYLLQHP